MTCFVDCNASADQEEGDEVAVVPDVVHVPNSSGGNSLLKLFGETLPLY